MHEYTQAQLDDLEYFKENLPKLFNDDSLRFKNVVISNKKVIQGFDALDATEAVKYVSENFKKGEYIIQQVILNDDLVNFV